MSCRILWLQELLKIPGKKHIVSPVPGNLNIADIGPKRLPKHRLEQLMAFCNIGSVYGDSFLSLKKEQHSMNQNQLRQAVGTLPAWQLRLMVLGALGQPALSFDTAMHDKNNEPNTLWLVIVATIAMCIFSFVCGCAIGCQFHEWLHGMLERFRGLVTLWRSSNNVDSNLDTATRGRLPDSEGDVQQGSPKPSGPTVMDLESRILVLLDQFVDSAMGALRQEIEPCLAWSEAMFILRVAYHHLLESHTHKDDVEDIIEIYECTDTDNYFSRRNYALQWVVATAGHYSLQRGMSMAEELKFVMECLIHRVSQNAEFPKAIYKSLKFTIDSLWKQFQADVCSRGDVAMNSPSASESHMEVDNTVIEPPLALPNLDGELEEMNAIRERAVRTVQQRHLAALDRGDFDAADFHDDQLNVLNMM